MRYQTEIALTHEQREAITQAMVDTQKKLVDLQWQLESASKRLTAARTAAASLGHRRGPRPLDRPGDAAL